MLARKSYLDPANFGGSYTTDAFEATFFRHNIFLSLDHYKVARTHPVVFFATAGALVML